MEERIKQLETELDRVMNLVIMLKAENEVFKTLLPPLYAAAGNIPLPEAEQKIEEAFSAGYAQALNLVNSLVKKS